MTPEEIAQKIIQQTDQKALTQFLLEVKEDLNLNTFRKLLDLVKEVKLRNARKALLLLPKVTYVAEFMGSEDVKIFTMWLQANIEESLFFYEKALQKYQKIYEYYVSQGDELRATAMQINQMAIYREWGQNIKAVAVANKARQACVRLGKPAEDYLAVLELNVAWSLQQMDKPHSALDALYRARTIHVEKGRDFQVAVCESNIAHTLISLDRFDEAEVLLKKNRPFFVREKSSGNLVTIDINLAQIHYQRGDYQKALNLLEFILSSLFEGEKQERIANIHLKRAKIYYALNLLPDVIRIIEHAKPVLKREKWYREFRQALLLQGMGYKRLGEYKLAERRLNQVRPLMKRSGSLKLLYELDYERAELAWMMGKPQTAQRITKRVLKHVDQKESASLVGRLHLLLARCALSATHSSDLAMAEAEFALGLAQTTGLPELKIQAYFVLGEIEKNAGNLHTAEQFFQKAITETEHVIATFLLDDLQIGYMSSKMAIYQAWLDLIHHLTMLGERTPSQIFIALLRTQATPMKHTFAKDLSERDFKEFENLFALRQQWHRFQNRMENIDSFFDTGVSQNRSIAISEVRKKQQKVEAEIAEMMRRQRIQSVLLERDTTIYQADLNLDTVAHVQTKLGESGLLHYYFSHDSLHLLLLNATQVLHFPQLASEKKIKRVLRAWRFETQRNRYEKNTLRQQAILKQFYQLLMQPIASVLAPHKKLLMVMPPHLHDLPFEAFYSGTDFLVEIFVIERLSSVEVLLTEQSRDETPLPNRKSKYAVVIGHSNNGRLPFAQQEASLIAGMLQETYQVTKLIESEATIESFHKASQHSNLIHIASHAIFRPDNPYFSWIQLADGQLIVNDLYSAQLKGNPLVVLSACETGRGQAYGGGLLGMTRAFIIAGASGLVVTLWRIVDESSADLMSQLYAILLAKKESHDISRILQQIQTIAIDDGIPPLIWAGFTFVRG